MAKATLPLMSGSASGSIAGAITFSNKYGNTYVGKKIVRNLSQSADQVTVRNLLRDAASAWNGLTSQVKTNWKNASMIPGVSGYNYFLKKAVELNGGSSYDGTFQTPTLA